MKRVKRIIFLFIIIIIGTNKANAEMLSNVSIKFNEGDMIENSYNDSYISVNADNFGDYQYKILITENDDNIPDTFSNDEKLVHFSHGYDTNVGEITSNNFSEYMAMYGNVYFTFYHSYGNEYNKASNPIFVNRPEYLPLTQRLYMNFYKDNSVGIIINEIYSMNSTIKFKLGEVNDTNLLKKLANSDNNDAYEDLLDYALNDNNPIKINQVKLSEKNETADAYGSYLDLFDSTKITKGNYYYGYFEVDTENGKYVPLVDIKIYKSESDGMLIGEEIKWNDIGTPNKEEIEEENKNENIQNPETGNKEYYIVIFIILFSLGIIVYYGIKKYKYFDKI